MAVRARVRAPRAGRAAALAGREAGRVVISLVTDARPNVSLAHTI